jgi:hypothetical protein
VVIVPFVLLADWQRGGRRMSPMAMLAVWGLCGLALPVLVHLPWAGLDSLKFLAFHGARGIEIESTYATLILALKPLGVGATAESAFGSIDLVSPLASVLAKSSSWLLLAVLAGLCWWSLRRGRAFGERAAEQMSLLVLLVTLALSKVLSAQFFVFLLPIMLLLGAQLFTRRERLLLTALCIAMAALTTAVFPYLWFSVGPDTQAANPYGLVPGLHPLPAALLALRNILFVATTVWLGWRIVRHPAPKPDSKTPAVAAAAESPHN